LSAFALAYFLEKAFLPQYRCNHSFNLEYLTTAMLVVVVVLKLEGYVLIVENKPSLFMSYVFTVFSLAGFFRMVSIENDKICY
jgi:hypothetical protein